MALPAIPKNPTKGKIYGYKKVRSKYYNGNEFILMLEIGAKTRRHFPEGLSGKARCEKAKVVRVWTVDKNGKLQKSSVKEIEHCCYHGALRFKYTLGKVAIADGFDARPNDCGAGINFFLNVKQAKEYI